MYTGSGVNQTQWTVNNALQFSLLLDCSVHLESTLPKKFVILQRSKYF